MEQTSLTSQHERLIRARELKEILGISSDATLWRWVRAGKLPKPQYLNSCRVWRESELKSAINALMIDRPPMTPMCR